MWLRAFLNDRRAYCRWENSRSRQRVIPQGLPQGSALSPLLWNAYLTDLPEKVSNCSLALFADDTAIWAIGNTYEKCTQKLQIAVNEIGAFCVDHWIQINTRKTVLLPLGNKGWEATAPLVTVGQDTVAASNEAKYLVIVIDSKLTFKTHSTQTARKYRRRNRVISYLGGKA